ncbi:hypothetical protein [Actibacterium mucosum]|nr:hypothetical protein [Actibacterium mucosum]
MPRLLIKRLLWTLGVLLAATAMLTLATVAAFSAALPHSNAALIASF